MKIVISESQYKRLIETEEEQKVLRIPSFRFFGNDEKYAWNKMQEFLKSKGNPPYSITGDVKFVDQNPNSLGKLVSVEGNLVLQDSIIEDLGDLRRVEGDLILWDAWVKSGSLGDLEFVGGKCDLFQCDIKNLGKLNYVGGDLSIAYTRIESLGDLKYIGGNLDIFGSELQYSEEEIRNMVEIKGDIVTLDPYANNVIGFWGDDQ